MPDVPDHFYEIGALRQIIEAAADETGLPLRDLTVLGQDIDPYRLDTDARRRNGEWFRDAVNQVLPYGTLHLRGLHYKILHADPHIARPDGRPYDYTSDCWEFLSENAAKSGRWLGLVSFDRITDERNEAPLEAPPPSESTPTVQPVSGAEIDVPSLAAALPEFQLAGFHAEQPYRIVLIAEKSSLAPALLNVRQRFNAEVAIPSGEMSDTMVWGICKRAARDGRPCVVFYCSDFDPSGIQMPVSVGRKIQAMRDAFFPSLALQLIPAALTLQQVIEYDLPQVPLKEAELRAEGWLNRYGREQTEIDALIAQHPGALERILADAIAPFYDHDLANRVAAAREEWEAAMADALDDNQDFQNARGVIIATLRQAREVADSLTDMQRDAEVAMLNGDDLPVPEVPDPILEGDQPEPLFTTDDDYVTATRKLQGYRIPTASRLKRLSDPPKRRGRPRTRPAPDPDAPKRPRGRPRKVGGTTLGDIDQVRRGALWHEIDQMAEEYGTAWHSQVVKDAGGDRAAASLDYLKGVIADPCSHIPTEPQPDAPPPRSGWDSMIVDDDE